MADEARIVRVTEFANRLGMTKARISRHFATLCELGLLERVNGEGFRLAWPLYRIGQAVVEQFKIAEVAHPFLAALRDAVRETTMLILPSEQGGVVTSVFEGRRDPFIAFRVGTLLPYHSTTIGQTLLAFSGSAMQERAMTQQTDRASGRHVRNDTRVLQHRLELIRKRFYSGEAERGPFQINVLAVPTFDHTDALSGAVAVIGPNRATLEFSDLVAAVQQCAREISKAMGLKRWPHSATYGDGRKLSVVGD
jgi:DNA-binding IclR family transcriptional regulator